MLTSDGRAYPLQLIKKQISVEMSQLKNVLENKNIHRFTHKAMATIFEIIISLDDKDYAEQAAAEAFNEIDRLENELSRFHPNSEIAKINSLPIGEKLRLNPDTFDSLKSANNLFNITDGIFDITAGEIIDKFKNKEEWEIETTLDLTSKIIGMNQTIIDETGHTLNVLSDDLLIDLGGFGKGYAIDKALELFKECEIDNGLIHSGGSTVKAIGKLDGFEGWPISISNPKNPTQTIAEVLLQNNSLSGSGKEKGIHIINPKTKLPIKSSVGAWAITESAATSDAMSTTFMIMQPNEVLEFCKTYNYISGLVVVNEKLNVERDDILLSENWDTKNIKI
jgi:thiamine biosynthesis lipoprotein